MHHSWQDMNASPGTRKDTRQTVKGYNRRKARISQDSEFRVVCSLLFESIHKKGENIALSGRGKFYEKAKEPRIACVP